MLRLMEHGGKVAAGLLERTDTKGGPYSPASELTETIKVFSEVAQHWFENPAKAADDQINLLSTYADLWNATLRRMTGEEVTPIAVPEPGEVGS